MCIANFKSPFGLSAGGIALAICLALGVMPPLLVAVEKPAATEKASGTFVSFQNSELTIKGPAGLIEYKSIDENYKTYQNNEEGPGAKLVDTLEALRRTVPGTVIHVDVDKREISCGLDNRQIGKFVAYVDGKLHILAADAPSGFTQKPTGKVVLTIEPNTPVLESIDGGDFKFVGVAGEVLKSVKQDAITTVRSEYDPNIIEVIQIGQPKRTMERYIGQTRATVRGTFMSFQKGVLKIRGKGVTAQAANEYERGINLRIADSIPTFESIDGGQYEPTTVAALQTLKEGTVVTIRKVEDVILEIQIGVAKTK